jgi:hypothetical protein
LRLNFRLPGELIAQRPVVTVVLNGRVLERFPAGEESVSRDYHITPAANGGANLMELSTSRTVRETDSDQRDLGLQVRFISWGPN